MQRILYVSTASCPAGSQDDFDILEESRRYNADHDVCGYLLRTPQHFYQILEGAERDLDDVINRIIHDKRHQDMDILTRHDIAERLFAGWSMGFKMLTNPQSLLTNRQDKYSPKDVETLLQQIVRIAWI